MKLKSTLLLLALCWAFIQPAAIAKSPENLDEALQCVFFVATFDKEKKPLAHGSAFLVEEDGVEWIHTNALVIDGSAR
jgi:hypothetical protein